MPEFSVVTIVKGRPKQLANLLQSVAASAILPNDIQVVCMDNIDEIITPESLNVNFHLIRDGHELPLAAARNLGIKATKTSNVIFIDVDCIVSPTLFATLLIALQADNIIAAYPLYLPVLPETGNYDELKPTAVPHPNRQQIPAGLPVDHLRFWSLIFAVQKRTFEIIGGFDESFRGYGAEDTDFAMMFHQKAIKLRFVRDYILHQYHEKYDPPLNHFDSVIENALRFKKKWNVLPMQSWLKGFAKLGLIKINEEDHITIIQKPDTSHLKTCYSPNAY